MTTRGWAWTFVVIWFLESLGFTIWDLVMDQIVMSLVFIAFMVFSLYWIGELIRMDREARK